MYLVICHKNLYTVKNFLVRCTVFSTNSNCVLCYPRNKSVRFNIHIQSKLLKHACHGYTLQLSTGLSV